jgi:hypothetical protein
MSFVFNAKGASGANAINLNQQFDALRANRADPRHALPRDVMQPNALQKMAANAGVAPTDLYQEFDRNTIRQFHLDEGEAILTRLMPLARVLPIGRLVDVYSRASGMGGFQTSVSGEINVIHDAVNYDQDKAIVPIHQNGFKRPFRQAEQFGLEGFQDLVVMQEEAVRTHRKGLIDYMLDGTDVVIDGVGWDGFRNDSRVDQVDLGVGGVNFDFTDSAQTGEDFIAAWIELAERLYVTNKISAPAVRFVSNEIYWNMQRDYSNAKGDNTIMQRALTVPGVVEIVPSSKLTGNQILTIPLQSEYIQPVVGAGVSTIALPRPQYNSPLAFDVMSAIGIQVKSDFETGNKAVQYAAS